MITVDTDHGRFMNDHDSWQVHVGFKKINIITNKGVKYPLEQVYAHLYKRRDICHNLIQVVQIFRLRVLNGIWRCSLRIPLRVLRTL